MARMTKKELQRAIEHLNACKAGHRYVRASAFKTAKAIWNHCKRGDWMHWLLLSLADVQGGFVKREQQLVAIEDRHHSRVFTARQAYLLMVDSNSSHHSRAAQTEWKRYLKVRDEGYAEEIREVFAWDEIEKELRAYVEGIERQRASGSVVQGQLAL